ncbi:MAG: hypothetical protein MJ252_13395 [archaeon]|nr:hypothetical protein [archaeon]
MSVADNFDYSLPVNSRKDLMSLSTINENDAIMHNIKKLDTQRDWSANLYNRDIEGAYPKKVKLLTDKVDFINKLDDIEKTNPKIIHYGLNKPEYNLSNDDIEKSKPKMGNFKTNRCCNPLEPKYDLPKTIPYPIPVPKFIRDQIDIKDIRGARPNPYLKYKQRETFPLDNGIEKSRPKPTYVRKTPYSNIDYSDITKDIFKSKRHTSPLDPIYEMKYKNGEHYIHGMIEGSKPQTIYPYTHPEPYGLKVNDISGAQAGTKNKINKFNGNNFNLLTKDIKGALPGSLKKGIVTDRNTNPLVPQYQYLGGNELYKNMENIGVPIKKIKRAQTTPDLGIGIPSMNVMPQIETNKKQSKPNSNKSSKLPTPSKNSEIDKEYNPQSEYQKNNFNKTYAEGFGKKPDPYFALIHDRYVQPRHYPEKKEQVEKQLVNNLTANKIEAMSGTQSDFNKASNLKYNLEENTLRNNLHDGTVPITQGLKGRNMNRTCYSSFPKPMTYEQKLDNFMNQNQLKYIGEEVKLNG